jgi:hypothetical protein
LGSVRLGLFALVVLLGMTAGCLNEFEEPPTPHFLRVTNLEISPAQVLSQEVILNVTAYLDNRGGGDSGAARLQAKAFGEANGFLLAEAESVVGVVPGDTTRPVSMQVKVPREGGVRVDVVLYEDDLGRQTASIRASNLGSLEPEVLDTGLRVQDVDFIVRDVAPGSNRTGARATIQTDLYVTNEGDRASEDLQVQVKAREVSTRLVSDVAWVGTGAIAPGATVIRSVNLTVPEGYNYAFEILTWRGEVIVARSEGVVQLAPTYVKPTNTEVVTDVANVRDFLTPTNAPQAPTFGYYDSPGGAAGMGNVEPNVPGPGAAALVIAVLAASSILVFRRRRAP